MEIVSSQKVTLVLWKKSDTRIMEKLTNLFTVGKDTQLLMDYCMTLLLWKA